MKHMTMAIAVLVLLLTGCVDNSGGPPPPGIDLEIEHPLIEVPSVFCETPDDEAMLLDDMTDADAWLAGCQEGTARDELRTQIETTITGLDANARLIAASIVGGGCVGGWSLFGIHLDDTTLRPWILKEDTSYGRSQVACTADIWWQTDYWLVRGDGVGDADAVELWVGVYNPDLPGAPALPGG